VLLPAFYNALAKKPKLLRCELIVADPGDWDGSMEQQPLADSSPCCFFDPSTTSSSSSFFFFFLFFIFFLIFIFLFPSHALDLLFVLP
jgi:hypothetical protein